MSRRLTGDFTGLLRVPLSNVNNDNEATPPPQKPSACTTFRVKSITNAKKFPFSKAQLTISLESEKVRSSEVCDGIEGLVGQELEFDTDPYLSRNPVFRVKEKDVTMSPDHGRTTKMAEGSAELKTDGRFPKTITVELTMRLKVVGVMTLEVLYKNLDLDKLIDDCNKGRVNGFKNFQLDADFDVVQSAAIEWVNCMEPAIEVVNYSMMKIDIGFCCTVWYKIRRAEVHNLKHHHTESWSKSATSSAAAILSTAPSAATSSSTTNVQSSTTSPRSQSPETVDGTTSPEKTRSPHSPRKKSSRSSPKLVKSGELLPQSEQSHE